MTGSVDTSDIGLLLNNQTVLPASQAKIIVEKYLCTI